MTFQEALAQQPQWVQIWSGWLTLATFIFPAGLLLWKQSRLAGLAALAAAAGLVAVTYWIFLSLGFVRLLGLGHLPFWIPLAFYLYEQLKSPDMPRLPFMIMTIALVSILVSLAFDTFDVLRYLLGETAIMAT